MTNKHLNLIVNLENTLGNFYLKIKNLARLAGAREVLEFMEVHSFEHANIIGQLNTNLQQPVLHESAVINFQHNLTKSVFNKVTNEKDILSLLNVLAESEESVGKLYMGISGIFIKISNYYRAIAAEIENIAKEEFNHRDLLLKDKARLAQKLGKG